jgi:hypothetical protein
MDINVVEQIREDIVLAKLSDTVFFKTYNNVDYIYFDKYVLPYCLFCVYLFSHGVWFSNCIKNAQRKDLLAQINTLWRSVGISTIDDLYDIKVALHRISIDPNLLLFFNNRRDSFSEALLYFAEQEYAKYCKNNREA